MSLPKVDLWSSDYQRVGWLRLYVLGTQRLWRDPGRCDDAKLGGSSESGLCLHTQRFRKRWRLWDWSVGCLVCPFMRLGWK